jgi:hypothetical protein
MLLHVYVISLDKSKGLTQKGPLNIHPEAEKYKLIQLKEVS